MTRRPWPTSTAREHGTWRTSSFSSNGSNCVEVLELPHGVWIRDSKDRAGPVLHCSAPRWQEFLSDVVDDRAPRAGTLRVRRQADDGRRVEDVVSAEALHFTAGEWAAFRSGVIAGEFAGAA